MGRITIKAEDWAKALESIEVARPEETTVYNGMTAPIIPRVIPYTYYDEVNLSILSDEFVIDVLEANGVGYEGES